MQEQRKARQRRALWRRRIAAGTIVTILHIALFGVVIRDWAMHRAPRMAEPVTITLERPNRPDPPPEPPPLPRVEPPRPPPPPPTPPPSLPPNPGVVARPSAPTGLPAPPPVISGRGAPVEEARPGGAINLGCLAPNLPPKLKEECQRKSLVAALEKPTSRQKTYEPAAPPNPKAPKSPEPGFYLSLFPPGFGLVAGPNDKGFPPGLGDTKTTVFEPAEIHDVPTPMR